MTRHIFLKASEMLSLERFVAVCLNNGRIEAFLCFSGMSAALVCDIDELEVVISL